MVTPTAKTKRSPFRSINRPDINPEINRIAAKDETIKPVDDMKDTDKSIEIDKKKIKIKKPKEKSSEEIVPALEEIKQKQQEVI